MTDPPLTDHQRQILSQAQTRPCDGCGERFSLLVRVWHGGITGGKQWLCRACLQALPDQPVI